jgi:hypothetical protein
MSLTAMKIIALDCGHVGLPRVNYGPCAMPMSPVCTPSSWARQ